MPTPEQLAALQELQSRRASLTPEKVTVLDELTRRWQPTATPEKVPGVFSGEYTGPTGTVAPGEGLSHAVARQAIGGVGTAVNNMLGGAFTPGEPSPEPPSALSQLGSAIKASTYGPLESVLKPQYEQAHQAYKAASQGDYSNALGHGIAAITPVAGPIIANATEKALTGTVGAASELATYAGAPAVLDKTIDAGAAIKARLSPSEAGAHKNILGAIKPPKAIYAQMRDNLPQVVPELAEQARISGKPNTVENSVTNAADAAKRVWGVAEQFMAPGAGMLVDTSPVADAIESSVTPRMRAQDPTRAAAILKKADTYRKQMPASQVEDFLRSANNDADAYYRKNPGAKRHDLNDPDNGHVIREANALRGVLFDKINSVSGPGMDVVRKTYGGLKQFEDAARSRQIDLERKESTPESQMAKFKRGPAAPIAGGLAGLLAGHPVEGIALGGGLQVANAFIDSYYHPNALMERAFKVLGDRPSQLPKPLTNLLPEESASTVTARNTAAEAFNQDPSRFKDIGTAAAPDRNAVPLIQGSLLEQGRLRPNVTFTHKELDALRSEGEAQTGQSFPKVIDRRTVAPKAGELEYRLQNRAKIIHPDVLGDLSPGVPGEPFPNLREILKKRRK